MTCIFSCFSHLDKRLSELGLLDIVVIRSDVGLRTERESRFTRNKTFGLSHMAFAEKKLSIEIGNVLKKKREIKKKKKKRRKSVTMVSMSIMCRFLKPARTRFLRISTPNPPHPTRKILQSATFFFKESSIFEERKLKQPLLDYAKQSVILRIREIEYFSFSKNIEKNGWSLFGCLAFDECSSSDTIFFKAYLKKQTLFVFVFVFPHLLHIHGCS